MTKISVVMSVHNGLPYLRDCLASLEDQTETDVEFILVDDASTDGSLDVLKRFAKSNQHTHLIVNKQNKGLTKALNQALEVASGTYIARIDADDMCYPTRFEKQLRFMEDHPQIVACASGYRMVDDRGKTLRTARRELKDWQIRWLLSFNPPAPHPTYFFQRLDPNGRAIRYNEDFATAQDYDLWSRLSTLGETYVMPEVLIDYRRHSSAITSAKRDEQAENCAKIGLVNLKKRYPDDVLKQMSTFVDFFAYKQKADPKSIAAAVHGADTMLRADTTLSGHDSRWLKRMTAGLLAEGILSRGQGLTHLRTILAFLFQARAYLPWLLVAVAKEPGLMIKSLQGFFATRQ
ncbi:glycosyltransferase family 2 protein [Roseovarius phycicola]|uniref:Glycosyltransferase n=1 Tax=Roseovarius phycicola TaxID=3080976 RepID=A0ABZ2HIV8_9RHOB